MDRRQSNRRKDPRDFGRRKPEPSAEQLEARFCAIAAAIGAGVAFAGSAILVNSYPGLSILAGIVAFGLLVMAVIAAGEA